MTHVAHLTGGPQHGEVREIDYPWQEITFPMEDWNDGWYVLVARLGAKQEQDCLDHCYRYRSPVELPVTCPACGEWLEGHEQGDYWTCPACVEVYTYDDLAGGLSDAV